MVVTIMLVVMEVKEVMTTVLAGMVVVVLVHSGGDGSGDHNISGDRTGLGLVW